MILQEDIPELTEHSSAPFWEQARRFHFATVSLDELLATME